MMDDLQLIKSYADEAGVGCVIRGDHVAIDILWVSLGAAGEERRFEMAARVASIDEARAAITTLSLAKRSNPSLLDSAYNPAAID